jgi:hypothetical protein
MLGPDGQRLDAQEHPEMACGSVEYIAPQEYMVRARRNMLYPTLPYTHAVGARKGAVPAGHESRAPRLRERSRSLLCCSLAAPRLAWRGGRMALP